MSDPLAELLVNEGGISAAALERALAQQRDAGGSLDTAVLELDLLPEERTVELLSRASGLPAAPESAWAAADPRARRVFPSKVAERHGLAPFALDGRDLSLVAHYPVDLALLDEISFMLSLHLRAHVGAEWRVRDLIQRLYGTPLPERLAKLAERGRAGAPPPPPPPPPQAPEAPAFSVDTAKSSEPLAAALAQAVEAPVPAPLEEDAGPGAPPPAESPGGALPARWTLGEARAALEAARDRDEVVRMALRYARAFFEYAALFAVTRDALYGHDALAATDEGARERSRMVAVPLSEPALFRSPLETRAPYLGPPPRDPGADAMLQALGREAPRTVLLYPVVLRARVVCLLYADNGEAPVSPNRLGDLLIVCGQLAGAFERIVLGKKRRGAPAVAPAPAAGVAGEAERGPGREPNRAPAPALEEFEVDLADPEPERLPPASPAFDPVVAVLDLVNSERGSPERGRLIALLTERAAESAPYLCASFPGPVEVRSEALAEATPIDAHGPIFAALAAVGTAATPYLLPLLGDADADRRRAAVRVLGHLADPAGFIPLADRVFDPDERVAAAARGELATLRRLPECHAAVDRLRRALGSTAPERVVAAARALGAARDVESVPLLIDRLENGGAVAAAAAEALTRIALQRHGGNARRWMSWWKEHRGDRRARWLFGALEGADRELRLAAAEELRAAGPPPVPYLVDAPPAQRHKSAEAWAAWFEASGLTL